jgi:hypothetical protein
MSHPVQGGSFTIPGPVYNGGYGGPQTPSESYWNEVDGYRSIGQSSPVFGNQSYGTYEAPSAPQQGFTIGAAPRVVFVPQYAPQPYAAPAQQQQFTIPQQYPGNVAPTYAADVVGAANYAATAAKDKVALDYIYRDSTRRGRTGMATTAKALGSRTLGIFGWLIGYDTACAPVSANSCRWIQTARLRLVPAIPSTSIAALCRKAFGNLTAEITRGIDFAPCLAAIAAPLPPLAEKGMTIAFL